MKINLFVFDGFWGGINSYPNIELKPEVEFESGAIAVVREFEQKHPAMFKNQNVTVLDFENKNVLVFILPDGTDEIIPENLADGLGYSYAGDSDTNPVLYAIEVASRTTENLVIRWKCPETAEPEKLIRLIESDEKNGTLQQDAMVVVTTDNEILFRNYYESLPFWLLKKMATKTNKKSVDGHVIYNIDKSQF